MNYQITYKTVQKVKSLGETKNKWQNSMFVFIYLVVLPITNL